MQITRAGNLFGLRNHFVAGVSFDGARNDFTARSSIGGLTLDSREFVGPGIVIDELGTSVPVSAGVTNATWGADGDITVRSGDRLPGIPAQQLKLGAYYKITDRSTVGLTGIALTGAYLFGDEANLTPRLPGYYTLNASATYQLMKHVQLFAWIDNLTDQKYYTFGTFSPTSSVFLVQAPNATNPRSYSPAAPIGGFVGMRVTY